MVGAKGSEVQFGTSSDEMVGANSALPRSAKFEGSSDGTDAMKIEYDAPSAEACMERCIANDHCNSFTYDPDNYPVLINKTNKKNLPNCLLAMKQQSTAFVNYNKDPNNDNEGYWWYLNPDAPNLISGIRCSFDNLVDPPRPADYVYTKGNLKILKQLIVCKCTRLTTR